MEGEGKKKKGIKKDQRRPEITYAHQNTPTESNRLKKMDNALEPPHEISVRTKYERYIIIAVSVLVLLIIIVLIIFYEIQSL